MGQGNKSSRILAWTFLNKADQQAWVEKRWVRNDEEE
jgi:23S rRNA (adenine1618-N6)-methyltransferase